MTALFCDVVGFIQLVANCKPSDVIAVLSSLYKKFDQLTRVHDTYRVRLPLPIFFNNFRQLFTVELDFSNTLHVFQVESIGDAYFVVSGTPESQTHHAERVANTALGMLVLGNEIACPLYGEKIQVTSPLLKFLA